MTRETPDAGAIALRAAHAHLGGIDGDRRVMFIERVRRWWPDLVAGVEEVYPDAAEPVLERLIDVAAAAFRDRPDDLHRLDVRRLLQPDWLQHPDRFGYACYTERFAGTLNGIGEHLDYLEELGVNYLHLMPLLQPREGDNDGGYAVADHRVVRPDLGTIEDLQRLATTLRGKGISLVLDLVVNHVAREHEWGRRALAGEQRYRDYFLTFPDRTMPDAYEETLPEVFPDFAPGSFAWDDELDAWVWTTFNSWQWDLNWANPAVLLEFCDLALGLANLGVEVLRLDAIAFLWKRLGTNCQNQPEVHALTQILRAVARIAAPALAFKAEAIVGPADLMPYLGLGEHTGRVSDLAYHNGLMVQIWSALAAGEAGLAAEALSALPAKPAGGTWLTYVRCHDDIGWAIDDADAGAVGKSGAGHRSFLSDWYSGEFPDSWADGLVFQENNATGDRRISGTAASLAGVDSPYGVERVLLAHTIAAGWGGIPIIWSGDELGLPNDPNWAEEPGHEDDNRWAHRPKLDWTVAARRHDSTTTAGRIFEGLAHVARVRASLPQLNGSVTGIPLRDLDPGIFAIVREHASGPMVTVYNLTAETRPMPLWRLRDLGVTVDWDALSEAAVEPDDYDTLWLPPYAALWLIKQPAGRP